MASDDDRRSKTRPVSSLVWTPLPLITWLIPIIGHAGISNSEGVIYDFAGDYTVSVDNFSFGSPTKVYNFSTTLVDGGDKTWDEAILSISENYERTRHSLFSNNCHRYVAGVLNKTKYNNRTNWTQFHVWLLITFRSRYLGWSGFMRQWCPFMTIVIFALIAICVIT